MSNVAPIESILRDVSLEQEIGDMRRKVLSATRSDVKRVYAQAMASLVALHSPERVAQMEADMGLR
jgi:hypothetical protein